VVGSRISIEFLLETLASGMTIPEIVEGSEPQRRGFDERTTATTVTSSECRKRQGGGSWTTLHNSSRLSRRTSSIDSA